MENQRPYIPRVAGAPSPVLPEPQQRPNLTKANGGTWRGLARYCWLSIPLFILVGLGLNALKLPPSREANLATAAILIVLWLSGIMSGIIALFGIRRHGRKGILIPTLVGLVLWMGMIAVAVVSAPVFKKIQERAFALKAAAASASETAQAPANSPAGPAPRPASVAQNPPVYPEGFSRMEDKEVGFSFAIPNGYTAAPEKNPDEAHSFQRAFFTEPTRIIVIKKVDGDYSRRSATAEDLPPPRQGQTSESAVFDWRGRKVGGTRSIDARRNPPFLVFSIVIPLPRQTIMLEVGGAADYEPVILETVDQILGSLAEEAD